MTDRGAQAFVELEELWARAPGFDDAVSAAEAAVVEWEWFTNGSRCSLEPYYAERSGNLKGRRLRTEPAVKEWVCRCGSDGDARVVAVFDYFSCEDDVLWTFNFFEGERCEQFVFDERRRLASASIYEYERGLVTRRLGVFHGDDNSLRRQLVREYFYEGDRRLARVHARSFGGGFPREVAERERAGTIETLEYGDDGKLERVIATTALGDITEVRYRRPPRGARRSKIKDRLVEQLAQAVVETLKGRDLDEPVWCVALHYDPAAPLPPQVVLGLERERSEWGPDVDLLNPAEWQADGPPRRCDLTDEDLVESCAAVWSRMSTRDDGARRAVEVLNLVAKRLNESARPDGLSTTDDFFVYAVDLELEDLDENLTSALSPTHYRALADAGLTAGP